MLIKVSCVSIFNRCTMPSAAVCKHTQFYAPTARLESATGASHKPRCLQLNFSSGDIAEYDRGLRWNDRYRAYWLCTLWLRLRMIRRRYGRFSSILRGREGVTYTDKEAFWTAMYILRLTCGVLYWTRQPHDEIVVDYTRS